MDIDRKEPVVLLSDDGHGSEDDCNDGEPTDYEKAFESRFSER